VLGIAGRQGITLLILCEYWLGSAFYLALVVNGWVRVGD